ncbi:MAG TPA: low specificity L-threonine aldolase [Prolixibacteraceae bacterium]|nr:low specificity L-threonine aldolase [Prolixibacteraceae bacterium]
MNKRGFASDNNSGIHPNILKAIEMANEGHVVGYGDDIYTEKAKQLLRNEFGSETEIFFVLTGTGANILSIQSLCQSFHSILCAETAHIQVDECGAPEKFTGSKLIPIPSGNGKVLPAGLIRKLHGFDVEHHAQPGLLSISQVTEMGTVYTAEEIRELADIVHSHGMYLHMDGARISNAAVSLGTGFRSFTKDAGVDVLSFGGTKNGLMLGEAVLIFNPDLARNTKYFRKQAAQLYSKMRFLSVQFIPYLEEQIWKSNALHANRMAQKLASLISGIPAIRITQSVDANGIFAILPREIIPVIRKEYFFYDWDESKGEVRLMTSFDTKEEDIVNLVALLKAHLGQ